MATENKITRLPQADECAYRVHYSPEDECYIGEADEFPGLSVCEDTYEEALREIKVVVAVGIQMLQDKAQLSHV